jgi:hypothetical protein
MNKSIHCKILIFSSLFGYVSITFVEMYLFIGFTLSIGLILLSSFLMMVRSNQLFAGNFFLIIVKPTYIFFYPSFFIKTNNDVGKIRTYATRSCIPKIIHADSCGKLDLYFELRCKHLESFFIQYFYKLCQNCPY